MSRRLLAISAYIICACSWIMAQSSWSMDDIEAMYGRRMLDPIEGVWKFPGDGATVMIIKSAADVYDVKLLHCSGLSLAPGTVIGTMYSTAKRNHYDGKIDARKLGIHEKIKGNNLVMHVNDEDQLILDGYREGYTVSFRRLIYRLFRVGFNTHHERPAGLTGARRKFPVNEYSDLPICL